MYFFFSYIMALKYISFIFFVYSYIKILLQLGINKAESVFTAGKQSVMLNVISGWVE